MPQLPRDARTDATLALLADPYRFSSKQCRAYGTDLFETRLMLMRPDFSTTEADLCGMAP